MKNIFKYILLVLIVAGTVVAYFSDVEVVEFSANITKLIAAVGGVLLLIFGILAGIKLQKK